MTTANLFADLPDKLPEEVIDQLAVGGNVRIERIVSTGHNSPDGFWYGQDQHEWVVVVQGAARLLFDGDAEPIELHTGDWVNIPCHQRHRVEWTDPNQPTVWLAVHYCG